MISANEEKKLNECRTRNDNNKKLLNVNKKHCKILNTQPEIQL